MIDSIRLYFCCRLSFCWKTKPNHNFSFSKRWKITIGFRIGSFFCFFWFSNFGVFLFSFLTASKWQTYEKQVAGKLNYNVVNNTTLFFSNIPGPQEEVSFSGHKLAYIASNCYGQPNVSWLVYDNKGLTWY